MNLFKKRLVRIPLITILIVLVYNSIIFFIDNLPLPPTCDNCNLILVSVDTLRADHMGVYGYENNITPNIDAWAKNATVFTNAYTIFPLTFQSFYTLFTGKTDVFGANLANSFSMIESESVPATLPSILQKYNYLTSAFITNPVIDSLGVNVFKTGFKEFRLFDETKLSNSINSENSDDLFYSIFSHSFNNSEKLTNQSIEWIKGNKNKKFFLWLHYTNPHEPYKPPQKYACKIDKSFCDTSYYEKFIKQSLPRCIKNVQTDPLFAKKLEELYDASILSVDDQIQRVLSDIRENNLEKKTIIVFYGDHGESFEHNIYSHGYSIYNTDVHIPLIIKSPTLRKGTINTLINNTDILPSLLDMLGLLKGKNNYSGTTFKNKQSIKNNNYSFFISPKDWTSKYGVTDGQYKYIYSIGNNCLSNNGHEELYNLLSDPKEEHNLINEKQTIVQHFKKLLLNYFHINPKTASDGQEVNDQLKSLGY